MVRISIVNGAQRYSVEINLSDAFMYNDSAKRVEYQVAAALMQAMRSINRDTFNSGEKQHLIYQGLYQLGSDHPSLIQEIDAIIQGA